MRHPLFRDRWIASLLSNLGTWLQDTAAAWLMTTLTTSPLLISLMQTAASLPVLLLGLPAGALADIVDRRKLLLFWQSWMLLAAVVLSVMSLGGWIGPVSLLALTLLLNVGAALNNPAWQAIVPELVPRSDLSNAISLNSAAFNLARAVGPALGGMTVALFATALRGASAAFLLNAASFLAVIVVLYRWKRKPRSTSALPSERMLGSIRAGARYVAHAESIRHILIRAVSVTSCVSAMWALLPVVARSTRLGGALGYGMLNACIGTGAVAGALALPRVRAAFSAETIVQGASAVFAITLGLMAFVPLTGVLVVALVASGFAWTATTSTFNIAVQVSVPSWVQARALGTYQMVFQGGMAIGSAAWGALAERSGTPAALASAGVALVVGMVATRGLSVMSRAPLDLSSLSASGLARAAPVVVIEPRPEQGPVLVSIGYAIDPADVPAFVHAIDALRVIRLRDGAIRWGLFRDPGQPARFTETFLVESWAEYLRQRERMTVSDLATRDRVFAFHRAEGRPIVSRMIYVATDSFDAPEVEAPDEAEPAPS